MGCGSRSLAALPSPQPWGCCSWVWMLLGLSQSQDQRQDPCETGQLLPIEVQFCTTLLPRVPQLPFPFTLPCKPRAPIVRQG